MKMKQEVYATMWGVVEESNGRYPLLQKLPQVRCDDRTVQAIIFLLLFLQLLDKLKSLGYTGIEMPIAGIMKFGSKKFQALLKEKGALRLRTIHAQCHCSFSIIIAFCILQA